MKIPFLFSLVASCAMAMAGAPPAGTQVMEVPGRALESPPPVGSVLRIAAETNGSEPDHFALFHGDTRISCIPSPYRESLRKAFDAGDKVRAHVRSTHSGASSNPVLQVEIEWIPRHPGDEKAPPTQKCTEREDLRDVFTRSRV